MDNKLIHICEVCGKQEMLTPDEAFEAGWDYPPKMGAFGVVSPRICGECSTKDTLWWALVCERKGVQDLTSRQKETLRRISQEPRSVEINRGV